MVSALQRMTVCNRYRAMDTHGHSRVFFHRLSAYPCHSEVAERVLAVANGKNVEPVDDVAVN